MAEEEKNEGKNALNEVIFYFVTFYILSMIMSFIYLWYFINKKIISKLLFVFCFIYLTFFVFLQFLVNVDVFLQDKDIQTYNAIQFTFNFIRLYYDYLRRITYALKFSYFFILDIKNQDI